MPPAKRKSASGVYGPSEKRDFHVFDKVFARMRGYPPWPAKIDHWDALNAYKIMDQQDREAARTGSIPNYQRTGVVHLDGGYSGANQGHGNSYQGYGDSNERYSGPTQAHGNPNQGYGSSNRGYGNSTQGYGGQSNSSGYSGGGYNRSNNYRRN